MTERDIYFTILNHNLPPRFPKTDTVQLDYVPGEHSLDPKGGKDWFGVFWHREPDGTQMPVGHAIESMEDWESIMPEVHEDEMKYWGEKIQEKYDRKNKVQIVGIQSGHFERMQSLVGFEDALVAFYEYPDETMAYMEAMTDYKIELFRQIKKYYNPDIVSPHDDWGTNLNTFISPDIWRKFIKPQVKRLVEATHEMGMLYDQHSCGKIDSIFPELVEDCKIDMAEIQGVNNLKAIREAVGNKVVLRSCFNGQLLGNPVTTIDEARQHVRNTLDIVARDGNFIAQRPWGIPVEMWNIVNEEFNKFSKEVYGEEIAR